MTTGWMMLVHEFGVAPKLFSAGDAILESRGVWR
jgi:hypothetical protein